MTADADPPSGPLPRRYEVRDTTIWLLLVLGLCLCFTIALTMLGSAALVSYLASSQPQGSPPPSAAAGPERPPKPRLQIDPSRDLEDMRRDEDAVLHNYGWIDRRTGSVRIPIDRAMDLLAAQHLGPPDQKTSQ